MWLGGPTLPAGLSPFIPKFIKTGNAEGSSPPAARWRAQIKFPSVVGFSFDYVLYNLLGYLCYSAYQCSIYFSTELQDEYKNEHDTNDTGVQLNDVGK